jgi:hypothetical protein
MTPHGPTHPPMERHELRRHLQEQHGATLGLSGYRLDLAELREFHRAAHGGPRPAWIGRASAKELSGGRAA